MVENQILTINGHIFHIKHIPSDDLVTLQLEYASLHLLEDFLDYKDLLSINWENKDLGMRSRAFYDCILNINVDWIEDNIHVLLGRRRLLDWDEHDGHWGLRTDAGWMATANTYV